ncbi:adhesion G protein-coupled receptor L1 isoform X2 [Nematostella vectensis]|uniref:adhesion G protein-coupled receptor L1 isoform X2 n=1 Tax=Nematostella vectensis TaxID=45351 RepID=UPI00207764A9|nr:adhesion G protein-coupled receptor L1 isoform X2 [Nematostella vectensis]
MARESHFMPLLMKIGALLILFFSLVLASEDYELEKGYAKLYNESSVFHPDGNGDYLVRILTVGGGAGGCGGLSGPRPGQRGQISIDIKFIQGKTPINVTVGMGGAGSLVGRYSGGGDSSFGGYAVASGALPCLPEFKKMPFYRNRGLQMFIWSSFTRGDKGEAVLHLEGGEGGILINNTGPPRVSSIPNTAGGRGLGYGAGGGSGGRGIDSNTSSPCCKGTDGASGVVYIEVRPKVCRKKIDVVFAIELRTTKGEIEYQKKAAEDLVGAMKIGEHYGRAAVVVYSETAAQIIGFVKSENETSLTRNILEKDFGSSVKINESGVIFSNLYATVDVIWNMSSRENVLRTLVLFTYSGKVKASDAGWFAEKKRELQNSNVNIIAVGLGTARAEDLIKLVTSSDYYHVENRSLALVDFVPWIADLACNGQKPYRPYAPRPTITVHPTATPEQAQTATPSPTAVPMVTVTRRATQTTSKVPAPQATSITATIGSAPSSNDAVAHTTEVTVPTSTESEVSSTKALPTVVDKLTTTQSPPKTMEELTKDFEDLMNYDQEKMDVENATEIERVVGLVYSILTEGHRLQNATQEAPELQVLEFAEEFGLQMAQRMRHDKEGVASHHFSQDTMGFAVVSVNMTVISSDKKSLRLTELVGADDSDPLMVSDAIIPMDVFSKSPESNAGVVWLTYPHPHFMEYDNRTNISSHVMAVVVSPKVTSRFKEPVELVFKFPQSNREDVVRECAFWDITKRDGSPHGSWSIEGCRLGPRNATQITCYCDHLTNFAILTRLKAKDPTVHDDYLTYITFIGLGLSIAGCVLTILTHLFLPSLRSERVFIHINLVTAILFAQILFIVGATHREPQSLCLSVAVLLYFFYMSVFTWMLVEGIHIYCLVIRVFNSGRGRKKIYTVIGWGLPALLTLCCASAFRWSFYTPDTCWLSLESGAIWAFVAPALVVIAFNLVILFMVLRVTAVMLKDESQTSSKALVKAFVTLLPILGLTWLFGFLAFNNKTVMFEYLFAIFNSMQGFLIFVFYCLLSSEVRREFLRKIRNLEMKRSLRNSYNPSGTTPNTPRMQMETKKSTVPELKALRELYHTRL